MCSTPSTPAEGGQHRHQLIAFPFGNAVGGSRERPATTIAGWSSLVARQPHKLEVAGSNPASATNQEPASAGFVVSGMQEFDLKQVWHTGRYDIAIDGFVGGELACFAPDRSVIKAKTADELRKQFEERRTTRKGFVSYGNSWSPDGEATSGRCAQENPGRSIAGNLAKSCT